MNAQMKIAELVRKNRTCRRFYQEREVSEEILRGLVDLARLSASGANRQPLRFILSCSRAKNELIFPHLGWAGYLRDWPGPVEGERPNAYILILLDTSISKTAGCDHGIAAQSIMLGAVEYGLAGCMIGSVKRDELRDALAIDPNYEILLALALGWPKEEVVIEPLPPDGDVRYWRDEQGVHHVPKRTLEDLIVG